MATGCLPTIISATEDRIPRRATTIITSMIEKPQRLADSFARLKF
ncbi:MAG: hypothetical protein NTV80_05545 [Verrucomicrobia bacterium]|nr:hypothetical protein [Verrucomicrobiota bacterium]